MNETNLKNGKSWLIEKAPTLLQTIILIVVGVIWSDLREVRDSSITQGTKQERLIQDVQNVEYTVRTLNTTVQRLVGQKNLNGG